jgi:hypothetical protein
MSMDAHQSNGFQSFLLSAYRSLALENGEYWIHFSQGDYFFCLSMFESLTIEFQSSRFRLDVTTRRPHALSSRSRGPFFTWR